MIHLRVTPRGLATLVVALAWPLIAVAPVSAQGLLDSVQIHGFGGWAYGETDGNAYLIGTEDGSYDNADFALNITAMPFENLSIVAQLRGEASNGDDEFELDYAFASYAFSDALDVRIGRVKHPLGLYGEVFDVGTLRPFYTLPQSLYGANGFTARAYNGVGLAGRVDWDSGWGLAYDLYFGQIEGDFVVPGLLTTVPDLFLVPDYDLGFQVNQTIGGRVMVATPLNGLSFGASAYTGDDETELAILDDEQSRDVWMVSTEFLTDRILVRAEWGSITRGKDFEGEGGYLEVAGKLTESWQLAVRWDDLAIDLPTTDFDNLPPFFAQILDHEELSLGVNYWFRNNFVVRLSYHQVEGNRFAFLETPEQVLELLATGELEEETDMIVFGAQFSF